VRLYMQEKQKKLYKKVDWSRSAENIIEDLYSKNLIKVKEDE